MLLYVLVVFHWGRTDVKLKVHYFGYLMRSANSLEKPLMLGKIEGKRRRGWPIMRWLDSITNSVHMNLSKPWEILEDRGGCGPWGRRELDMT